jgi:ATP-dependent Clp protease ATP-binding subunit ClpA
LKWFKSFGKEPPTPPAAEQRESGETMSSFTPHAQQVLGLARKEAERLQHHFVGTEHVLLGLISRGEGVAVAVLRKMGLDLDTVRIEVETQVGTGPDPISATVIPYTPRVKKVLALAAKEAKTLHHIYVGTEHILLGLIREGEGVAARVLKKLEVDVNVTRQNILRELDPHYSPASETTAAPRELDLPNSLRGIIDVSKRYDVYCREGDRQVVYRNAIFRGVRKLLPQTDYDLFSDYAELEQADGQTIFVARSSIIKFCEPGMTPGSEPVPGAKPSV